MLVMVITALTVGGRNSDDTGKLALLAHYAIVCSPESDHTPLAGEATGCDWGNRHLLFVLSRGRVPWTVWPRRCKCQS